MDKRKQWMPIACDDPNSYALPRNYTLFCITPPDLPPWISSMTCGWLAYKYLFVNSHFFEHLCLYVDVCLLTHLHLNLKPLCCLCFKAMLPHSNVILPTSKLPFSCFTLQASMPPSLFMFFSSKLLLLRNFSTIKNRVSFHYGKWLLV